MTGSSHLLLSPSTAVTRLTIGVAASGLVIGAAVALLPLEQVGIACAGVLVFLIVLLIFAEPVLGLAFTLFAAPFGPLENILLGLPLDSGQALLLVTLGAFAVRALYRRKLGLQTGILVWPLVLFISIGVLSFFEAQSLELWIKECIKWIEVLVVYGLVVTEVRTNSPSRAILIGAILASTLFEAALGIYQFGIRGKGPLEFAIVVSRYYRAYGTLEQPNPFGGYMGLTWPFAAGVAIYLLQYSLRLLRQSTTRLSGNSLRYYAFTIIALLITLMAAVALVLSWSRGAWLGAGVAAVVMLIILIRRPVASLTVLLTVTVIVVGFNLANLLPTSVRARLTDFTREFSSLDVRGVAITPANYAVIERLAHWQAAEGMIVDHPYLGIGFGNYSAAYDQYRTVNWPIALGHAHNYYLNIFAETGILGLVAFLALWVVVLLRSIRMGTDRGKFTSNISIAPYIALGLLGVWAQLSVHQLVDNLYVANLYLLIGVYFGLLDGFSFSRSYHVPVIPQPSQGIIE